MSIPIWLDQCSPTKICMFFDLCSTERFMQKKKTKSPKMTAAKNILITAAYFLICV